MTRFSQSLPDVDIKQHRVDMIHVPERIRSNVDPERVAALADSMKEIGLMTPITVFDGECTEDGEAYEATILVAGLHRLMAAKELGWPTINCAWTNVDEFKRQIWEIDENLARAELTTEEKREHIRRRKELWEARQKAESESGKSFPTLGRGKEGFAAETARATGLSKRRINQLIADPKPRVPTPRPSSPPGPAPKPSWEVEEDAEIDRLLPPIRDAISAAASRLGAGQYRFFRLLRDFIARLEDEP